MSSDCPFCRGILPIIGRTNDAEYSSFMRNELFHEGLHYRKITLADCSPEELASVDFIEELIAEGIAHRKAQRGDLIEMKMDFNLKISGLHSKDFLDPSL